MREFVQQVLNGLTVGSIYALVAVGYTLVYGVLRLMNFAHGSLYTFGAYACLTGVMILGWNFPLALLLALVLGAIAGGVVERVGYYPLRRSPMVYQIVSVFALSIVIDNSIMLIWGAAPRPFTSDFLQGAITVAGFRVSLVQIAIMAMALFIMAFLMVLVFKTRYGLAMRATALNTDASILMGVPVSRLRFQVFMLSSALAAAAGSMVALNYQQLTYDGGLGIVIKAFVVSILGGIGNVPGAILGGIVLGQVESLGGAYVSTGYKDAFVYIIMILVLILRPNGLLGTYVQDKV